jgi:hypothetical protein
VLALKRRAQVTLFQFCNSYFALFYIAFVKAQGFSIFNAFGLKDRRGRPYEDMCGAVGTESFSKLGNRQLFVRGDCIDELVTLMLSHLVIKPLTENLLQLMVPYLKKKVAEYKRKARAYPRALIPDLRLCRPTPPHSKFHFFLILAAEAEPEASRSGS